MNSATGSRVLSLDEAAAYRPHQVVDLSRELADAKHQIDWFKRQIFGQKSERRIVDGADGQMSLGEMLTQNPEGSPPPPAERASAPKYLTVSKFSSESMAFWLASVS